MEDKRLIRWSRAGVRLLVSGTLFLLLVVAGARLAGCRVAFENPRDWTRETSLVDLSSGPLEPRLANDFDDTEICNVVLLIADGMGFSHVVAARSELVGLNRRLGFERMPITGWLTTHDAGRVISDSAATATAMATGVKTTIGHLSIDVEGRPLRTVLEAAGDRGMAAGLITDSYLWDATVSAFAVHAGRRDYAEIVEQMSRSGVEILFGESCPWCFEDQASDAVAAESLESAGYTVASNWDDLRAFAADGKLAGLFESGVVPDRERSPRLPQLTSLALERLAADPDGFFLVVETEETDTASHRHEFQRMVQGIRSFDETAAVVLDFARRDRGTLVLLTADHETGGLSLSTGRQGEKLGARWTTHYHTGMPVPLFAYGPGAEHFGGSRDNTEIAQILSRLLGLRLESP